MFTMKTSVRIYLNIVLVWTSYIPYVTLTGDPQVMGSCSEPVLAKAGDDVILPWHIKPAFDPSKKTVQWSRPDLNPQYVHVLADGREVFSHSNPLYKRRTSLFHEELPRGNISLKLFRVQLSDEGKYKCYVPFLDSSSDIQLLVGFVSPPVISLIRIKGGLLSWSCDSGCWYPQPEVSWLDSDGNDMTAEPSVTRRSEGCFTVQRDVTVRAGERVTCRVHLPHINHTNTVETLSVIPEALSQPAISQLGQTHDGVSFSCDSGCWYPEPEVSWLDGDGNILPAEPSVTVRRSHHCYIVQRNVTVTRAGRVTCRVHTPHLAEMQMDISEDAIPKVHGQAGLIVGLVVALVVSVLFIGLPVCCYLKRKKTGFRCVSNQDGKETPTKI